MRITYTTKCDSSTAGHEQTKQRANIFSFRHQDALLPKQKNTPVRTTALGSTIPILISISFLLGLLLAIGHHVFYNHWNHQPVKSSSQQQWIIRGGTAFAFGVKTFLVLATSVSYTQVLFWHLRGKATKIEHIDSMFGVLANPWNFRFTLAWLKRPSLLFPAMVAWLIPISAIITPGTLTTALIEGSKRQTMQVAVIDFEEPYNFGPRISKMGGEWFTTTPELDRVTTSFALNGYLPSIPAPAPNSSYSLVFDGPAIQCVSADADDLASFNAKLDVGYGQQYGYLAWVPTNNETTAIHTTAADPDLNPTSSSGVDQISTDSAKLFVYAAFIDTPDRVLLQCSLQATTYMASFQFVNGVQNVTVDLDTATQRPVPFSDTLMGESVNKTFTDWAYISLMAELGRLLIGKYVCLETEAGGCEAVGTSIAQTSYLELSNNLSSSIDRTEWVAQWHERFFQNITLSLLGDEDFLNTDPTVCRVPVDIAGLQSHYAYTPLDVWLAYGIALLCAAACIALGSTAILRSGHAFSTDFSTIMRTTRSRELERIVFHDDSEGAEPRSEFIAQSYLRLYSTDDGDAGGFRLT